MNWIELDQEFRKAFAELLRDPASYRESELDHRRLQIWDFGYIGLAQFSSLPMSRRVACTYSDIDSRFPNLFFEDEAIDQLWQVSVSDSLKERLFSGNDAWGLWFLACQPNLTGEDLERLLRECDSLRTRPGTDTERTSFDYREDKTVADVEWQIVGHPNVTADILERLSRADSEVVRRAVAGHKSCDLASLQRLASESSVKIRCSVAGNPNCDEQALRCLSNDEEDAVVASMARNGNAPLSLLEEIIDRGGPYARAAAAKNPNLSLSSMAKLAHGEDEKIKYDLAQNPRCPGEVLRELLTSDDSYVIGAVLENKGCPTDILKRYANSERAYFRKKVVWNQKTPADVVRKIALDLSEKARIEQYVYLGSEENDLIFAIVTSEHCTAEIVRALPVHEMMIQFGWHSDLFVTTGTLHGAHEILRGFAESPYEWVREKAFGHPSCPEDLLVTAAVHSSRKIRHAALMNPSCPSLVIDILTHGDTLEWLATNARAKEILALLGNFEDEVVRRNARANCYHPNFLESILFDPENSDWFRIQLRREVECDPKLGKAIREHDILYPAKNTLHATHSKSVVARVLARAHPMQTPMSLAWGIGSKYWLQRMAAARNKNTPRNILEKLASDKHPLVAAQAKASLELQRGKAD